MPEVQENHPVKVTYTGAVLDISGYAAAAREYILSLLSVGVEVAVDPRTYEPWRPQKLSEQFVDRKIYSAIGRQKDAPIHIIHLTPDNYLDAIAKVPNAKYKIGYFAWETSRIPHPWVKILNSSVDEVWAPCDYLKFICIASGVTIPVRAIPHAIPLPPADWKPKCEFNGMSPDIYKFYSIFQWSARKNPAGLLKAYYEEFNRDDPVLLVVKTYRVGNGPTERDYVRKEIVRAKRETKGNQCPKVLLIESFLNEEEIRALHYYGDCYVTMTRSEGFGITPFEAAAMSKPVIVPDNWAFAEHFTDETGYLIDVPQEVPIRDMRHISVLYSGDMTWGDPSIESCKSLMRKAFSDREEAKLKGKASKVYVGEHLSHFAIGALIKRRLEEIYKERGL